MLLVVACDRKPASAPAEQAPAAPAAAAAAPNAKLEHLRTLFGLQIFGVQIAYLENVVGPAMRVAPGRDGEERRTYEADACDFMVDVKKNAIVGLSMETGSGCPLEISRFLPDRSFSPLKALTFGGFDTAAGFPGDFHADCLQTCPNVADPVVTEAWNGPHADNFIEVELAAPLVDDAAIAAAGKWVEAMKGEGDAYIDAGRFNKDGKYQPAARAAFKDVRVASIAFHQ